MTSDQPNIDARYRTMLTLWFAMMMSVVMWFIFIHFMATTNSPANPRLGFLLICLGLVPVSASFLAKQILVGKAIEAQDTMKLQQAYVVAWALCEAAGLLGLLAYFLAASPYYYVAFIIAGVGILVHFPQKRHL